MDGPYSKRAFFALAKGSPSFGPSLRTNDKRLANSPHAETELPRISHGGLAPVLHPLAHRTRGPLNYPVTIKPLDPTNHKSSITVGVSQQHAKKDL